jgi:catechol 2,3-dioxygenase-like lactoylglutathione lyase family enzyme
VNDALVSIERILNLSREDKMKDIGLTHIALQVSDIEKSVAFYARYAAMEDIHKRIDAISGAKIVWLSDRTRPFAIVLAQSEQIHTILKPFTHLGVGCKTPVEVDRLCELARLDGVLIDGPNDNVYPVGYWAFLRDPDGHTLELSYGQEIGLTTEKP